MRERLSCLIGLHARWLPVRGDDGGVDWVCGSCGEAVRNPKAGGWFVPSILALVLALVLGIGLGIGIASIDSDGDRQPSSDLSTAGGVQDIDDPGAGDSSGSETGADSGDGSAEAALQECQALFARQVPVALAADASLDQWRQHIDAMNQLVAGEITLDQATAFWNDTRLGAHRKADRFTERYDALANSDLACEAPSDGPATTQTERRLVECQAANTAFDEAMTSAEMTLMTWVHHIQDMDALLAGEITPEQATAMWIKKWKVGAQQLQTYDQKARSALSQSCD